MGTSLQKQSVEYMFLCSYFVTKKKKETRPVFVFNKKGRAFRQHLNPLIKMLKHFQNFVHVLKKINRLCINEWPYMNSHEP